MCIRACMKSMAEVNTVERLRLAIREATAEICPEKTLKEEQEKAILALLQSRDVLGVLPTGFGKSLIFQIYVAAKTNLDCQDGLEAPKILVICPLVGLVKDQQKEAESLGLSCTCLRDVDLTQKVREQIIFASAEEVQDGKFKSALKRPDSSLKQIRAIVVDESHTLETWTGKRKSKDKSFRGAYGELATLRSLCKEGIPLLALTGTADKATISVITTSLAMREGYLDVFISPNRINLRINVIKTKKEDIVSKLDWIVTLIKEHGVKTPKCIIFCNTLKDVATVTNQVMMKLGSAAYYPSTSKTKDSCLIGIYHSLSWDTYKDSIVAAFKGDDIKRVIIATTALSMGVNFPDIRYVINWGPARSILDHHQEAGRAGRDGQPADVVVIYHGNQLSHCEDVKQFVRATDCLRVASYKPLDPSIKPLEPLHDCCSNCRMTCCCNGNDCKSAGKLPFEQDSGPVSGTRTLSRPVSDEDRTDLSAALKELQLRQSTGSTLFDGTASHGFSVELIDDLVKGSPTIFSLEDITSTFPVFSVSHAIKVLEVFDEIFGDIPNLEDTVNLLDMFSEVPTDVVDYYGVCDTDSEDGDSFTGD